MTDSITNTLNATGRVAQPTKEIEVKSISLEHSLQTLQIIETPVEGYIVGIIELREGIPTGTPGETEDWSHVHSAGGFGMYDMLLNLFQAVSAHIGEIWGSDDARKQAIEQILHDVRADLADERQVVIAKQTA